jgi:hypothetical protein
VAEAAAPRPSHEAVAAWIGYDVDEVGGARVGRVDGVFADAASGEVAWLVVAMGRRRVKRVAVPAGDCAGAGGRVWTAHGGEALRSAPAVDPVRPLLREHELAIGAHYGIGERVGRCAEVAARPEGTVTAQPAR